METVTLGYRVLPRDGFPIVGFPDRRPNLYIAALHSGMTMCPIIGQLAAMEILDRGNGRSLGTLSSVKIQQECSGVATQAGERNDFPTITLNWRRSMPPKLSRARMMTIKILLFASLLPIAVFAQTEVIFIRWPPDYIV